MVESRATTAFCQVGNRVMAMTRSGGFAEECIVRASDVFVLPDSMDFAQTGRLFYRLRHRAHYGLKTRARLGVLARR